MEFCPKCGSMLIGKNCNRCDYKCEHEVKLEASQKMEKKKEVVVVNDGDNEVHPIITSTCPKCQHKEAYFWTKQTRSGDEAETKFLKCTKCKHTWRDYN
ncbi:Transcription factor S [uncultured archaeon]|nr:Transcription factor S [uncultured archaeon]